MEAAEPIRFSTPKPLIDIEKIDFIEELKVIKENENYNIQFGLKENKNELTIKVISQNNKDIYYFQQSYTLNELQNLSKIFAVYETMRDIIIFFKNLKFEFNEKNEYLILKFNVFLPDGKNKLIELKLKKYLMDVNQVIKNLFAEIQSIKGNMQKEKQDSLNRELDYKKEMSGLKTDFLNRELNYKKEISNLKQDSLKYIKEISALKEENKKLWNEINKLKSSNKINKISKFDSKIIDSINKIEFLLGYIRKNDKSFNFREIKLLFRGSRDGDRTKTCHQLCDNKRNILIIIESDIGYIFGGYTSVEFKINYICDYKIDNKCFLFSINLKKIYPVIKDKTVICHIGDGAGLCFGGSLAFYDYFMSIKDNEIMQWIKSCFNGLKDDYEMNGNESKFRCNELEVFQLI